MEGAGGSPTAVRLKSMARRLHFGANRPEGSKDDWHKMLPKPGVSDPKDREAELSSFRDWWWSVEQYLMAVDSEYLAHFDVLRKNLDTSIDVSTLTADQKRRGTCETRL